MVHSPCSLLLQVMACCLIMMPKHLPSQFLNWTQRNKCHSNLNQDIALFVNENAFENVCKLMSISFKPQCVNSLRPLDPYRHWQSNHHWFRQWIVTRSVSSHYLNQCWNIVNWTLRNKRHRNFNWKSYIFIEANTFENVVCKIVAILSWPQCVKQYFAFLMNNIVVKTFNS